MRTKIKWTIINEVIQVVHSCAKLMSTNDAILELQPNIPEHWCCNQLSAKLFWSCSQLFWSCSQLFCSYYADETNILKLLPTIRKLFSAQLQTILKLQPTMLKLKLSIVELQPTITELQLTVTYSWATTSANCSGQLCWR